MNYYRHIDRSKVQFDFLVDADSTLVPREEIESLGGRVFEIPPYQHVVEYQRASASLSKRAGRLSTVTSTPFGLSASCREKGGCSCAHCT